MYSIKLTEFSKEICKRLPPEIKRNARNALKDLETDPFVGKPLRGNLADSYSFRFMRYRIIYEIDAAQKKVTVTGNGHRSSIYETMAALMRERREA